ncbi:hypothetical protein [Lentilactobacillus otakiensis]|uniref:hypothetical protein n=1 Tax=Lentilactobacillus otakiensis TaxID=481720 RepID=UPI003D16D158
MTFDYRFGLASVIPFFTLMVLYPLINLITQNWILGLLIASGILFAGWGISSMLFLNKYLKIHPRLDPAHYEFNPASNTIFYIGIVVLMGLVVLVNISNNIELFLGVSAGYYFLVNGSKTYREISK